jgi:hypothetical protein
MGMMNTYKMSCYGPSIIEAPLTPTPCSVGWRPAQGDGENWCQSIMALFDHPKVVLSGLKEKIDSLVVQGLFLFIPVMQAANICTHR